nr:metalloregulator ArsR/SmtB family transcription factor [Beijerinckia sp. L45]
MTQMLALGDVEPAADLLKSLANPQRLMIVCTLVEGERSVADLERALAIRQPSLSQHLGSLREAGIIAPRREAKSVYYRLSDERAIRVIETLHAIFCKSESKKTTAIKKPVAAIPPKSQARSLPTEAARFARVGG